jgi:hypothetical protein
MKGSYPSLYLNIARGYKDRKDLHNARKNCDLALSFTHFLPEEGYGKMIKSEISAVYFILKG